MQTNHGSDPVPWRAAAPEGSRRSSLEQRGRSGGWSRRQCTASATTVRGLLALLGLGGLLSGAPALSAPAFEQSFTLRPGWNAIYLEVQPEPGDCGSVFSGLPVKSVWTWLGRTTPVAYIQDPSEGLRDQTDWVGHFPAGSPEAPLTNLFHVRGGQAYLVEIQGTASVTWKVSGQPSTRVRPWIPDSFNLVGFPLDPAFSPAPSFTTYFAAAPAHADQPVYRLDSAGQWTKAAGSEPMKAGEAYWVYSAGPSSYFGPLVLDASQETGDALLEYGSAALQKQIRLRKLAGSTPTLTVRQLESSQPVPLLYRKIVVDDDPQNPGNPRTRILWPALPSTLSLPATNGQDVVLALAVQRSQIAGDRAEAVLSFGDGAGTRLLVPVTAERLSGAVARLAARGRGSVHPLAGLWMGTATLKKVSEAQPQDPNTPSNMPRPTASQLTQRLIVHVDAAGQARLLKEVIQMWQDGTADSQGNVVVPGHHVLITDDGRIGDFKGAALQDGELVGVRYSSATLDFDEKSPSWGGPGDANDPDRANHNTLRLEPGSSAGFALGGQLSCEVLVHKSLPTNPFRHKFHPDHDNLDALYVGEVEEAIPYSRVITLELSPSDPQAPDAAAPGSGRPGWGSSLVAGTYREEFPAVYAQDGTLVSGIHKRTIIAEGSFELRRVSDSPTELNPEVTQ